MSTARAEFQLNEFATVAGAAVAASTAGGTVVLTIEVEPAVWETIDLLELFHLGLAERHEGAVSGERLVQIELRLDPATPGADRLPADPDELAAAITGAPADDPIRAQTSWYALSVTEAIDLPPELAGLGDVRSGFSTRWSDT